MARLAVLLLVLAGMVTSSLALGPEGHTRIVLTRQAFKTMGRPADWTRFQLAFALVPGKGEKPETLVAYGPIRLSLLQGNVLEVEIRHDGSRPTVLRAHRPLTQGALANVVFRRGQWLAGGIPDAYDMYVDGYQVAAMPVYLPPSGKPSGEPVVTSPADGRLTDFAYGTHDGTVTPCAEIVTLKPDFSHGWAGVYHDAVCTNGELTLATEEVATEEALSEFFSVEENGAYELKGLERVLSFERGESALSVWVRYYFEPEETCSFGGDRLFERREAGKTFEWRSFAATFVVPHWSRAERPIRYARIQAKVYRARATSGLKALTLERKEKR